MTRAVSLLIPVSLVTGVVAVVATLVAVATATIVGRRRIRDAQVDLRKRLRSVGSRAALLGGVLVGSSVVREVGTEVSWVIGWNITGIIYAIEGDLVARIQAFATPTLTALLSAAYVYGYAFLLVFPLVAYLLHEESEPLEETLVAYAFNYVVGLCCYVAFVSYGPRNLLPELVEPLLYVSWPRSQLLTSQVNTNTNVFPSLHASLSVTVALLAYRTRETYPEWAVLAPLLAATVLFSTMYLGIHWVIDVLAGGVLGVLSVLVASRPRVWRPGRRRHPSTTPAE